MRWRRWFVSLGLGALGVIGIVGIAGVGFVGFLGTAPGNRWIEARVESAVQGAMVRGTFEIDGLETNLWRTVELRGVRILDGSDVLLELDRVDAELSLVSLLYGPLWVGRLEATGLDVVLDSGTSGRMRLAELFGPPSGSTEPFSLPIDLQVVDVQVDGLRVRMDGALDLRAARVEGTLQSSGPVFELPRVSACAHLVVPGPAPVCLDGPVRWDGVQAALDGVHVVAPGSAVRVEGTAGPRLALDVDAERLDLEALDPLLGAAGLAGTWGGEVSVEGPLDALQLRGRLAGREASRGSVGIEGRVGLGAELTWGGALDAEGLHVEDLYPAVGRPVVLDGEASLDGTGTRFPDALRLGLTYRGDVDIDDGAYVVRSADVEGVIEQGVLTLDRGAFRGIAGPLDATGTLDLHGGPMAVRVRGALDPAELERLGVAGLGGNGRADLRVSGDLKGDAGRFGVRGRVVYAPFTYEDTVRFERLTATVDGVVDGPAFAFDVDLSGTEGVASGLEMESLVAEGLAVTSRAGTLTVSGPAELGSLAYPGVGTFESARAGLSVAIPAEGPLLVEVQSRLGAFDLQTFPGDGGELALRLEGPDLRYRARLVSGTRVFAESAGRYDLDAGRLEADGLALAPTPRLAWSSPGALSLTVVDGGIADADIELRGLHGNLVARGDLGTRGALDGDVRVEGLQLDALAELFPETFDGLSGVLDLESTLRGPAGAPDISGTLDLQGLWYAEVTRWLDVGGPFAVRDGAAVVDLDIGSAGEALGHLEGRVPLVTDLAALGPDPDGTVGLAMVLHPGGLDRLEHVTPTELGLPDGRISATVEITDRLKDPVIRVAGVAETAIGGWQDPGRVELDLERRGFDLELWASLREGLSDRTSLRGRGVTRMDRVFAAAFQEGAEAPDTSDLALWVDDMAMSVVVGGLPADSLMRAAETGVSAGGDLVGGFTFTGSPYTPVLEGGLHWMNPSIGRADLDGAWLTVVPEGETLVLDTGMHFPGGGDAPGGRLTVAGPIPLVADLREDPASWSRGPMELAVSGDGVPLELLSLVDPGISHAEGRARVSGRVLGTPMAPVPELSARVSGGGFHYDPVGIALSEVEGTVEARDGRLTVPGVALRSAPLTQVGLLDETRASRIRLEADAAMTESGIEDLAARVELQDAWVMGTHDTSLRLDGVLALDGTWPALRVTTPEGDLEVVTGRVRYDTTAAESASLQPSQAIVIHRESGSRRSERGEEPPFYEDFAIDIGVDLNRNFEVVALVPFFDDLGSITASLTKATAEVRLSGDLDVAMREGEPALVGEVGVADGSVQLLRTVFDLDGGTVIFLGGETGGSPLDIQGSTKVGGTTLVELSIGGTVDEPTLQTTADGYDETQVLVMLLTGEAPEELTGDRSQAAQRELVALAGVASGLLLGGSAAGALSIAPDGSIRVGAPWSASVLTQLVYRPFRDEDENLVSFALEWALARRLLAEAGAGDRYLWVDLSLETRF